MTILIALVAVIVLVVVLVVVLARRGRGADEVPHRDDWELGTSQGVGGYRHEQGGPTA